MKPDRNADDKFEWDMTTVLVLVLLIAFVLVMVAAFGQFGHRI